MADDKKIKEILDFWFVETPVENWFIKDSDFDERIKTRFGDSIKAALDGALDGWAESRDGILALIIILDQFTRNTLRDTPGAFSGDAKALALSQKAQARGDLDADDSENRRQFLLMPMMHSEDIEVQEASLPLFEKYAGAESHKYAILHRDIIARFGRYPHRNAILGRDTTDEEEAFLKEPNSSF